MAVLVTTTIDRVTVYRNGALVVRRGELGALPAAGRLEIRGLPLLYGHDTLRLRTDAAIRLGAVEEVPDLDVQAEQEGDVARLREARERLAALGAERAALEQVDRLLEHALDVEADELPEQGELRIALGPLLDDQARLAALREEHAERRAALRPAIDAATRAVRDLEARRRADALDDAGRPARATRALTCAFEGACTGGALEVEYFVRGARWAPVYELHVAGSEARLHLAAQVAQATGEAWTGARIALSTADLRRGTRLPELGAWRIGRATNQAPLAWRPLPEDLDELFADHDRALPPPPPQPLAEPAPASAPMAGALDMADEPVAFQSIPEPRAKKARALSRSAPASVQSLASKAHRAPEPPSKTVDPGRLLDYAWLQLPDWSERQRGRLVHVGLESRLRDFVTRRGGEPADLAQLQAALRSLRAEQRRLDAAPLPPGCSHLRDASFHHRYQGGPRVTVAADGRWHRVLVEQGTGRCHELFRVVPKRSERVFRFAVLKNPLAQPLASGPLEVYVDGAWQVRSTLDAIGAGGTLRLNLGVEEGLRVARHVVYDEVEHGVLATDSVLTHRIRTELRSALGHDVRVQVFEQLAEVLHDDAISVSLGETRPEPVRDRGLDGQEQEGALRWDLDVSAGQAAELSWSYTITLPAKCELVGGNRREP